MRFLRRYWSWIFLGATSLVLAMELFAANGPEWATTWTYFIVKYIPAEVAVGIWGFLASWSLYHFWVAYRDKHRESE